MNKTTELFVDVFNDGSEFCALVGPNIQEGTAGFGETISEALRSLADELEGV